MVDPMRGNRDLVQCGPYRIDAGLPTIPMHNDIFHDHNGVVDDPGQ